MKKQTISELLDGDYLSEVMPVLAGNVVMTIDDECGFCAHQDPDDDCSVCGGAIKYKRELLVDTETLKHIVKSSISHLIKIAN
ncbi:TPA: hypothetical protein ACVU5P_004237 [Vibrio parahaemolyticus]